MECGRQQSKVKRFCSNTASTLRSFLIIDGQNTRDQITRGRKSKPAWSNCILCIPFILSGSPKKCWLHTCDAYIITTWRIGLQAPLVAHNYCYFYWDKQDVDHSNRWCLLPPLLVLFLGLVLFSWSLWVTLQKKKLYTYILSYLIYILANSLDVFTKFVWGKCKIFGYKQTVPKY